MYYRDCSCSCATRWACDPHRQHTLRPLPQNLLRQPPERLAETRDMPRTAYLILSAFAGLVAAGLLWPVGAAAAPPEKVDYNFQVRPLLADRCFVCHGPDEKKRKADLRLDVAESARRVLVPGKPEESEVVHRITATGKDRMPPAKSNLSLSRGEIDLIRRWVAQGAEYKPHWAFLPLPEAVPLPAVSDRRWPGTVLDHFILARLDREGLRPSPPAPREDWIRRVTFDLTGLPPAPA